MKSAVGVFSFYLLFVPIPLDAEEFIHISAQDLFQAYQDNEIAADKNYKGKSLEVSGEVGEIGKDMLGTPFIIFGSANKFQIGHVQCMFPSSALDTLARVKKGEWAVVHAKAAGKMMNVVLRECVLGYPYNQ